MHRQPGVSAIKLFTAVRYAFQVLHSRVGSLPYPQTLDQAGKACQEQTLYMKIRKLRTKTFYYIEPWCQCYEWFFITDEESK